MRRCGMQAMRLPQHLHVAPLHQQVLSEASFGGLLLNHILERVYTHFANVITRGGAQH